MRVITLLAAALSFGAATAFPFVEEVPEKSLVRRTRQGHSGKSGHGGRRGGSRERKAPGTGGREGFNPNAPAHDQNRVHHSIQNSNQWHDNHYPYPSYEYSDKPRDQYGFGNSYMQTTRNTFGAPNFQFQMGSDRGPDHVAALMDREMRIPESSQAQYLPSSPHEMASRRHGPGGTLGGLPHHRHIDSNHEEKFAAGGKAINANYKDIGIVPATVYDTAGSTSRYQDSPAMKMGRRAAINDPNPYATFGVSANPSREFQQEFDRGEHPTFPLRAPKHPGLPDPVYSYDKDPQAAYGHSSGLTPRSSSNDDSRSNSPTRDSDRGHRIRDDRKHRHKKKSHGSRKHHKHDDGDRKHRKHDDGGRRRRHDKRDVVDRIGKHQSNSDSQSNEGQKTNTRQAYQELMESYDTVVCNATELILPMLYEMVNGSNSYLVWDAAWEIASLANPGIMMVGGPFFQGMHSLDYWENKIEGKVHPDTFQSVLALNGVLIPLYQDTWKKCNETLTQAGYLDLLDQLIAAFQTNDTSLADIKPDPSNTKVINDLFLYGPDESDLAWWPGDEEADSLMFANSTSRALNSTSSSSNSTFSDLNSTSLSSSPSSSSNLTASPRIQQEKSNSTAKGILPIDSRAKS